MSKTVKAIEKIVVKESFMMPTDGTANRIYKVGEEVSEALLNHPFFNGNHKNGKKKVDVFFERVLTKDTEPEKVHTEETAEVKKTPKKKAVKKSTKKEKGK